jgi:SAM-dependent methyltransferase
MAQYDEIAEQYKETTQLEIFRIISHTMSHWIGDVTGRSMLDLACGEGGGTRTIKQAGAGRVVGVDVSEEMIRLAREAEAKQPLGIEYLARAAQGRPRILGAMHGAPAIRGDRMPDMIDTCRGHRVSSLIADSRVGAGCQLFPRSADRRRAVMPP